MSETNRPAKYTLAFKLEATAPGVGARQAVFTHYLTVAMTAFSVENLYKHQVAITTSESRNELSPCPQ